MKNLITVATIGMLLASSSVLAEDKARTPQQNRMAVCNKEATGKTGDARKGFMKSCLSAGKTDVQHSRAKSCNAEASGKKGTERKAFLDDCLKKA